MNPHAHIPPRKPLYSPKVTRSIILICTTCKKRYIKTRRNDEECIQCLVKAKDALKG